MTNDSGDLDLPKIDLPKDADSVESIVRFLIGELVRTGRLPLVHSASIMQQILKRESLGSTAIGRARAILHAKSNLVETEVGIVGRCALPVNWPGAPTNQPVNVVCLLVAPESQHGDVLKSLEAVARRFSQGPDAKQPAAVTELQSPSATMQAGTNVREQFDGDPIKSGNAASLGSGISPKRPATCHRPACERVC
jgi:mannitol/fructose-specific phosphotransferase system IIA component (Ntr-type)